MTEGNGHVIDPNGEARRALHEAVAEHGPEALSNAVIMDSVCRDHLAALPGESTLIGSAARTDVPALLRDLIPRLGNYGAIQAAAAALAEGHELDITACLWVVREFARALGHIAPGPATGGSGPITGLGPRPVSGSAPRPVPGPVPGPVAVSGAGSDELNAQAAAAPASPAEPPAAGLAKPPSAAAAGEGGPAEAEEPDGAASAGAGAGSGAGAGADGESADGESTDGESTDGGASPSGASPSGASPSGASPSGASGAGGGAPPGGIPWGGPGGGAGSPVGPGRPAQGPPAAGPPAAGRPAGGRPADGSRVFNRNTLGVAAAIALVAGYLGVAAVAHLSPFPAKTVAPTSTQSPGRGTSTSPPANGSPDASPDQSPTSDYQILLSKIPAAVQGRNNCRNAGTAVGATAVSQCTGLHGLAATAVIYYLFPSPAALATGFGEFLKTEKFKKSRECTTSNKFTDFLTECESGFTSKTPNVTGAIAEYTNTSNQPIIVSSDSQQKVMAVMVGTNDGDLLAYWKRLNWVVR